MVQSMSGGCGRPAGSFADRAPGDCGSTRCGTCHPHKWPRTPTLQEQREAQEGFGNRLDVPLNPIDPYDTDWSWLARRMFSDERDLLREDDARDCATDWPEPWAWADFDEDLFWAAA